MLHVVGNLGLAELWRDVAAKLVVGKVPTDMRVRGAGGWLRACCWCMGTTHNARVVGVS